MRPACSLALALAFASVARADVSAPIPAVARRAEPTRAQLVEQISRFCAGPRHLRSDDQNKRVACADFAHELASGETLFFDHGISDDTDEGPNGVTWHVTATVDIAMTWAVHLRPVHGGWHLRSIGLEADCTR
jgi:hypothetical protein